MRYYGEWMRERAQERIGHLYPKHKGETVIAWLWARTVISPNPAVNAPVPLVSSFALSKKKGRECWARPVIEGTTVRFVVTQGKPPKGQEGTMRRQKGAICAVSGEPITFDYIRAEGKAGRMGAQLMAIVTEGKRGRSYYSPSEDHAQIAESAVPKWKPVGDVPEQALGFRVQLYGMDEYHKLFTPRQLTALTTFSDLVHEARELATQDALAATLLGPPEESGGGLAADDDRPLREGGRGPRAYGEAVSVYLAFALSRTTNRSATICIWNTHREGIEQVFGRQAIPMTWDFAEANLLSNSTGNWAGNMDWIGKVLQAMPRDSATGVGNQSDAHNIETDSTIIATDPPYYDNIGYADLSDYFYVWLRQNLRDVYPEVFGTMLVPKSEELIASPYRHGGKDQAKHFFESGMQDTFGNLRRFVSQDIPLTVYYAFKQQDAGFLRNGDNSNYASTGWETMLSSLIASGFRIMGTWPTRTERPTGLKARTNALASSIVLVCRPRPADAPATSRRRFLDELRAELPAAIEEMKTGSIAPVDMAQATIGPGMAIYSRYRAVQHANGAELSVREALGLINQTLDEVLEEQDANLDPETRFAVGWFDEGGFKAGDFGRADVLARGKNTSVESVALAGLVEAEGGVVRLINWREYDPGAYDPGQDKRPTVWEGAHHLIERLQHHGETGAALLYNKLPGDIAESARDLAYRLYHICDRKGWAAHALDYNTLVSSWSEITRLAASSRGQAAQGELFD